MYVSRTPDSFDPIVELFVQLAQRENPPIQGENQKQREIAEARRRGFREGVVEGIATILNKRRCEAFIAWGTVPLLDSHEVSKAIQALLDQFRVLGDDLPALPKTPEEKALIAKTEDMFFTNLVEQLNELAVGADMAERELERHMKAVLAGEEDPTEADRPWLEERLAKARELNKEIEDLIKVVTPRGRPIKDQPQA